MASNSSYLGESAHYRFVNAYGFTHPHFIEYNRVHLKRWGQLTPTPVHFEAGNTSNAYIELSGLGNLPTRLVRMPFVLKRSTGWIGQVRQRLNGFVA